MTQVQLILLLTIIIVVLLLIDACRCRKHKKYKRKMAKLKTSQEKNKIAKVASKHQDQLKQNQKEIPKQDVQDTNINQTIELGTNIKVDPQNNTPVSKFEEIDAVYPYLDKGIVSYFISTPRGYVFNGKDLDSLFKDNGLIFNVEEQGFVILTQDKDILFSIKADLPTKGFNPDNFLQIDYTCLLCTCKIAELVEFYEPQVCFKHFTRSIEKINTRLGGTLLNEHKRRFTSHDETAYKQKVNQFKTK